jgi:hypothetical protein
MLRWAERVIEWACHRLPEPARGERAREWRGELPVILADPDVRFALVRITRMLVFALGVAKLAHSGATTSDAARHRAGTKGAAQVVVFAVARGADVAAAGMRTARLLFAPWPVVAAFVTAHDADRTNVMSLTDVLTMAGSVMGFAAVSAVSRRFWRRRRAGVR